jgi:FkbM family methyltransferase
MAETAEDHQGAMEQFRALMARWPDADQVVAELKAAASLHPHKRRTFQAELIARVLEEAAIVTAGCGWTGKAIILGGQVLVDQDGALFPAKTTNRYFRTNGSPPGAAMLAALETFRVRPRIIFDVGANIGELAIYFARRLPDTRVIAFEPAPENLEELRANIALRDTPLANLEIVAEAISDRTGVISFTIGAGDLNTTMVEANLDRLSSSRRVRVVEVPTDTLDNFCARLGVDAIDLLKVDTEGGEPLMATAIRGMAGRIRTAFVEMTPYNTLDAYAELIEAFAHAGLVMLDKNQRRMGEPVRWLQKRLDRGQPVNVWFVERARATG